MTRGGFFRSSIVPNVAALGRAIVQETELVVHPLVHAVAQPIAGMVRGGEQLIQDSRHFLGLGTTLLHWGMGAIAGYVVWEGVRMMAPEFSNTLSDTITRPFKRQRRMPLDRSRF